MRVNDRRGTQRLRRPADHGIVSARVRAGDDVEVVDVSAGGALIETGHRLLPGAAIELHLARANARTAVRGRVVRCAVAGLRAASICYRGAVRFDRHLPWYADGPRGSMWELREGPTHHVL
jgi:hypothetical protein